MRPLIPSSLLLFTACSVEATMFGEDSALSFGGDGCVEARGDPVPIGTALTVELWVRAEPEDSGDGTLVTLGQLAMLWADADGTGLSQPADHPSTGWTTGVSLYNGSPHHVAATWSPDSTGNLYIDGIRSGSGSPWTTLPGLDAVTIGCWPDGDRSFSGIIDEVRVSTVVRYPTNFNVPIDPFEVDESTLALWHLDEGVGEWALEQTDRFPGEIRGATWTSGLLEPVAP